MAAPLVIGGAIVAISAASAIAQYLNSERGAKLREKERKRLEGMIQTLTAPDLDITSIPPEDLKLLEKYVPQVAEMVYEAAPELVTGTERGKKGALAQEAALAQFEQAARGLDRGENVYLVDALNRAVEQSMADRASIIADMQRRGVAPSSQQFASMQQAQAGQSQKAMYQAALQAALQGQQRRDVARQQAAGLGGQILGYETELERMNDAIINEVNRRNTQARRDYNTNRANAMNQANMFNIERAQRVADANVAARNAERIRAQDLYNKQQLLNYQTEADKLSMMAGQSRIPDIADRIGMQNQAMQGVSDAAMMAALLGGKYLSSPAQQTTTTGAQPQQQSFWQGPQQPRYGLGVETPSTQEFQYGQY